MRFVSLDAQHRSLSYILGQVTGNLLCLPSECRLPLRDTSWPKLEEALRLCNNPYCLKPQPIHIKTNQLGNISDTISCRVARRLVALSRFNFWLACRYASLGRPIFSDAAEAIRAFHCHTADQDQKVLCLPRSLFAARMSQKFADMGVVLIGVFLPSRSLHAWIIEDGIQPDSSDKQWLNFQPVAAIF